MTTESIKIPSSGGGEFDCCLVVPPTHEPVPAVVLASAVHGVDADIVAIAAEFAAQGFIAAAPDLFWRTIPGPLAHDDERTKERSQPRLDCIKQGEARASLGGYAAIPATPTRVASPARIGVAGGSTAHRRLDRFGGTCGEIHHPAPWPAARVDRGR